MVPSARWTQLIKFDLVCDCNKQLENENSTMNSSAAPEMIDTHWERLHPALVRVHTQSPLSDCSLQNVCIKKQVRFCEDSEAT
jgi:hypothetical protein